MQTLNKANERGKGSRGFTNPVQSISSREVKAGTAKPAIYLFFSDFFWSNYWVHTQRSTVRTMDDIMR